MKFDHLLLISRPKFWLYLLGPYMLGHVAATTSLASQLSPSYWLYFLFFTIPANLFLYGINDFFDRDTDLLNSKKQKHEHLLAENQRTNLMMLLVGIFGATIILITMQPNPLSAVLLATFIVLATAYSTPPLRFKAKPGIDFVSNVLYIIPGLLSYAQLTNQLPPLWVVGSSMFWVFALHLFSAIPDIAPDSKVGLKTSAVVFGYTRSLVLTLVFWLVASGLFIYESQLGALSYFVLVYPFIPLALLMDKGLDINKVYWYLPYLNAVIGFVLYWLLAINRLYSLL